MNTEILKIAEQLKETYEGEPWFGKSAVALLGEAEAVAVFETPNGQHSIVDLLWHMITWYEFTISRLRRDEKPARYFESRDWQPHDVNQKNLWPEGLKKLGMAHNELVEVIQQQQNALLIEIVPERPYNYRCLLYGIVQHTIYHLGQIAYVTKLLKGGSLSSEEGI